MGDVQRWASWCNDPMREVEWGKWVTYADHVRVVAEMEQAHAAALVDREAIWQAREDSWVDWSNDLADLMPEEYDGDEAQEAIIERWVRDIADAAPRTLTADENCPTCGRSGHGESDTDA